MVHISFPLHIRDFPGVKTIAVVIFMAVSGSGHGQEPLNPNFDISSVREFWKILAILEADREPTETQWDALFNSAGHKSLGREITGSFLIPYLKAAYQPSSQHLRGELLEAGEKATHRWYQQFPRSELNELAWTQENRDLVMDKMNSFQTYPYTRYAVDAALDYLPEEEASDPPLVTFVIFNDSRGYDPVVMSLNLLAREEAELTDAMLVKLKQAGFGRHTPHVLYFGHEFFHYFRDKKKETRFPEQNDDRYPIVWLMDQIENEGIADLINVKQLYWGENAPLAGSVKAVKEAKDREHAEEEVRVFFALLKGIADHPEWTYGLGRQAQKVITRSGHVAGFYMANVILEECGKEDLIAVCRNPFRFFLLYEKAASRDGTAPRIPEEGLRLIEKLDKEYTID
ncbi:hypothetical protein JXO52_14965 [bacterium]|nr:hypothetical protein [bacterium]